MCEGTILIGGDADVAGGLRRAAVSAFHAP